ncbi:uncharacterized protein LOC124816296 [Hydra vulgaris]|uniref:uncharacterized protein LOC124816296 n=1 Tax=Hydra vulgaris TaxID=6087 RepID=UPI001F5E62E7|nr:uncharacterized protein LOC124816296 [Hydra vulgaris]
MAFSKEDSSFTLGFKKFSHIYQRIKDHEESKSLNAAVIALLSCTTEKDISSLITKGIVEKQKAQVLKNIKIFKQSFSALIFIGKQALSYRGNRGESLYSLHDKSIDYGNFLKLILLIPEFDVPYNDHIEKDIQASQKRKDCLIRKGKGSSRGRGGLVTMLSKTTVNRILAAISNLMKNCIIKEIGDQKFSAQMDGSQDTSVIDQETIIIRYALGEDVKKRLFVIKNY